MNDNNKKVLNKKNGIFKCKFCQKSFAHKSNLIRHGKTHNSINNYHCSKCYCKFTRFDNLKRHLSLKHVSKKATVISTAPSNTDLLLLQHQGAIMKRLNEEMLEKTTPSKRKSGNKRLCEICGVCVNSEAYSGHLKSILHKQNCKSLKLCDNVELIQSAFKKRICVYKVNNINKSKLNIIEFFEQNRNKILELIEANLKKHTSIKVHFELFAQYMLFKEDINSEIKSFNVKAIPLTLGSDINEIFEILKNKIVAKSEQFQEKDSGWGLQQIRHLEVGVMKYNPLRASSYIELPASIKSKMAVVNIQNNDDACFAWAVVSAIYPATSNVNRVSSYPHYLKVLNFDGLEFPLKIRDISKFEKMNNFRVSINVYGLNEENNVVVYSITECVRDKHINLLYIYDDATNNGHYMWIKSLSRLVSSQLSRREHKKHICHGCLIYFQNDNLLKRHQKQDCKKIRVKLPTKDTLTDRLGRERPGNLIKFQNPERKHTVPFVIYADSETMQSALSSCVPNPSESFTHSTHKHLPYGFGYYIACSYNNAYNKYVLCQGETVEKCVEDFIDKLVSDVLAIYDILQEITPLRLLSANERSQIYAMTFCHICDEVFTEQDHLLQRVVLDHDHLTGEPRGLAHNSCNINYKIPNFIPVFFHNLSGFDCHVFIKQIAEKYNDITAIPLNKEKYISFSVKIPINFNRNIELRFLDSFRFLSHKLEDLAEILSDNDCVILRSQFPNENEFKLLRRKGVFPYEYLDSLEKLNDTKLPKRSDFFSKIKNEGVSKADYKHARTVWDEFKCKTLADYSKIYLKTDVLILADCFENFRRVIQKEYKLDPAHYFTTPGLSWDAMLKYTGVELELLTDIDMIHFIRRALRGGISQCSNRYSKANNQYMKTYDSSKSSTYLIYVDANNQYGWAMSQPLPYGGFRWLESDEIKKLDVTKISDNSSEGYFLEVDLEYPFELHDLHNDLPFCSEHLVPPSLLSKEKKLLTTLFDKKKYVIHYRALKQCIEHGLILRRVHRVLVFSQSTFLKTYIDNNTRLRTLAKSAFEQDLYKLNNNACYGKSVESVEKRVDVKLISNWNNEGQRTSRGRYKLNAENLISKPNFHSMSIFTENFVAIQMNRLTVEYNKPNYIGLTVLDLSKTIMYDFLYSYIKKRYESNARVMYIDTDSFILEITTNDIYDDIKTDIDRFDTSNFDKNNRYNLPIVNEKVLGKFKFETKDKIITHFVGLKSKMYSLRTEDNKCVKKAKGVKQSVVEQLNFHDYLNCLKSEEKLMCQMCVFRSIRHDIYTQLINKVGLSANDDKRYIKPNSTDTLSWGHYSLR